ncbi:MULTISPECIES: recombinase family protein [Hyphomicrobiales]|uniref:recombinase family protein n=1 Tax=Hyphomicrobiales TaxID=356 RepID=UPI002244CA19|nr:MULTISPECIES: recombinase family protein [Hyphomicrobiales]MCW8060424.1 recombinase family protein [Agrobacterium tumefaciens]MCW8145868.1 recombinase family protein [Agrobacterium tumefaciens]
MRIGYARVSTEEQKMDLQMQALQKAGCDKIFTDHGASGGSFEREGLEAALASLRKGDVLIVWRLDRLGRSLSKLVDLMDQLGRRQIDFLSLSESIDTGSSGGRLLFHMMAALAEFERSLISERTRAGMQAARQKGKHLGRRPSLSADQVDKAIQAIEREGQYIVDVAERFDVSRRSLTRLIKARRASL